MPGDLSIAYFAYPKFFACRIRPIFFSFCLIHFTFPLPDHPIRPEQHRLRNRHADLLAGFQIDDELKRRHFLDLPALGWMLICHRIGAVALASDWVTMSSFLKKDMTWESSTSKDA